MYDFQEQFYQAMTRIRGSRAASTEVPKDEARVTEIINGLFVSRPRLLLLQVSTKIADFLETRY